MKNFSYEFKLGDKPSYYYALWHYGLFFQQKEICLAVKTAPSHFACWDCQDLDITCDEEQSVDMIFHFPHCFRTY